MFNSKGPTVRELLQQVFSSTEKAYDLLAPKFDYTPFRTPDIIFEAILPFLGGPGSYGSAIDICCGTGASIPLLRSVCRDRIVGIDLSQGMLDKAAQNSSGLPDKPKIEFLKCDALSMPFNSEFDLALFIGASRHFAKNQRSELIDQVIKVLKPGGKFVFVSSHRPRIWSRWFWFLHIADILIFFRNLIYRPKFMFSSFAFVLPDIIGVLESKGFSVQVKQLYHESEDISRIYAILAA